MKTLFTVLLTTLLSLVAYSQKQVVDVLIKHDTGVKMIVRIEDFSKKTYISFIDDKGPDIVTSVQKVTEYEHSFSYKLKKGDDTIDLSLNLQTSRFVITYNDESKSEGNIILIE
jgi:hypothetical protein